MATHLRWALAAAAVAGVSILSVQQTGALWSDSANSDGAMLNSGNLALEVGDGDSQVSEFSFESLTGDDMMSGDSMQQPLHVSNAGTTSMDYRLASAAPSVDAPPLLLRVSAVSSGLDCSDSEDTVGTELYNGPIENAVISYRPLSAEASEVLCFRVTMGEDAEAGQSGNVTFTFEATQVIQP